MGIEWVLAATQSGPALGGAARDRACRLWDSAVVAQQYAALYESARSPAPLRSLRRITADDSSAVIHEEPPGC